MRLNCLSSIFCLIVLVLLAFIALSLLLRIMVSDLLFSTFKLLVLSSLNNTYWTLSNNQSMNHCSIVVLYYRVLNLNIFRFILGSCCSLFISVLQLCFVGVYFFLFSRIYRFISLIISFYNVWVPSDFTNEKRHLKC